ncbi:MAG: hypothetical protein CUN56_07875 [Phototrophicales bacterium]|nr:MAG: hypothetical protein CUN56_07875 [Phototrophicales bacterium]
MKRWLILGVIVLIVTPSIAQRVDDDISAPTPVPTAVSFTSPSSVTNASQPLTFILIGVGVVVGVIVLLGVYSSIRRPQTGEKSTVKKERPLPTAPNNPVTRPKPQPVIQLVKPEPPPPIDDIPSELQGPRLKLGDREFPLPTLLVTPFIIGRSIDAHLRLPDQYTGVSLLHCFIEKRDDRYYVMDGSTLGKPSEKGTFVNNERVIAPYPLYPQDEIRLGQQVSIIFLT